jgi:hypothetical protein
MFSESAINFLLSGALGATISGIILTLNNRWITATNNQFQLEREKEQGIRQQESEQRKWYREKIYDSYKRAIQLLTEMMQIEYEIENKYKIDESTPIKFHKLSLELMSEFELIIYNYPAEDFEEYDEKIAKYGECLGINTLEARSIFIELMENDSRIINIINKD